MTETLPATSASRRSFLRGAVVAGTAVWVVPAVQLIGLDAASAAEPSSGDGPVETAVLTTGETVTTTTEQVIQEGAELGEQVDTTLGTSDITSP